MSIVCRELISKIEMKYPKSLAESYDNVGLLVGDENKVIKKILLTLDINEDIVKEAISYGADMILSHHPLIFKPIKRLTTSDSLSSMIISLIKSDINVYALHTNFDNARHGMNDILAELLELQKVEPLVNNWPINLVKLVVFVPKSHHDAVMKAVLDAGAGHIGNYSHCSFNIDGMGTFLPMKGSKPFLGAEGRLERAEEVRLETIVEASKLKSSIEAMLGAHPYEEVAYDIYPLQNTLENGTGRIGFLKEEMAFEKLCYFVKDRLGIPHLTVAGLKDKPIKRIAIIGGAGADFLEDAVMRRADVLITGDLKHHQALDAVALGLNIIDGGHYFTEVVALPYIQKFISSEADVECRITELDTNELRRV